MIRTTFSKTVLVAAAMVASGAMVVNCSSKGTDKDQVGSAKLALTLPGGGIVNTVTYSITGAAPFVTRTGTIDVTNKTSATALVSGLPVGSYTVTMNASTVNAPAQTCGGSSPFTVTAPNTTAVATVILQCRGVTPMTGSVAINGHLDQCPYITGFTATDLEAAVGSSITISVGATDLDGDTVTYAWTQGPTARGTFANAAAASTTFTCTSVGTTSLSIAVSDSVCGDSLAGAIPVTCVAAPSTGGAGTGAAGTGAAGTGAAGTGEAGTGAAGTGAAGTGTAGTGVAGTGAAGTGAAGTGAAGTGAAGTGGPVACVEEASAACISCITAPGNCAVGPAGTDGCCGLSDPADVALCRTLLACINSNASCAAGGDSTPCFCGTSGGACFATAGAANGVCASQFIAAAKTTSPPTIQDRFVSPNFPIGRAVNQTACAGSFCNAECGL